LHALIAGRCDLLRVHDVQGTVDTLRLVRALRSSAACGDRPL
jgi:dihydropteroate synthase